MGGDNEQVELHGLAAKQETPRSEIGRLRVMRGLGYDIDAINRSGRDIGSSIDSNTVRVNPRSVVGGSGGPADARGFDERLDDGGVGGSVRRGVGVVVPGPAGVGWTTRMLQGAIEGQEKTEGGQRGRTAGFLIDRGRDNFGAGSGFGNIHLPPGIIVSSDVHPAIRSSSDNANRRDSHDSFPTPKQATSSLGTWMHERDLF